MRILKYESKLKEKKVDGYTGDRVCTTCNETVEQGTVIAALGHAEVTEGRIAATCTTDGYTGDTLCRTYNTEIARGTSIPALGHKTNNVGYKAVTCTVDGYSGDKVCGVCNTVVEKGVVLTASHNYMESNGEMVCTNCSDKLEIGVRVEQVIPVVKEEAVEATKQEILIVIEAIKTENAAETLKEAVSEETIAKIEEAVEAGKEIITEVVSNIVEETSVSEEVVTKIEEILSETQSIAQYLDIEIEIKSVEDKGETADLGNLNVLQEEISFSVMVPEELEQEGRMFFVLRIHDGEIDKLPVTKNEDGSYSFFTNKFSTYVLAYEDETEASTVTPNETPVGSTEENSQENMPEELPVESGSGNLFLYAIAVIFAVIVVVVVRKKS